MELLFASHNRNKTHEIQSFLGDLWLVKNLHDLGFEEEIPETGTTIEENALIKAKYLYQSFHVACFADDSGLEVNCLNGAPGVYSARYAGVEKSDEANMNLLLSNLATASDRSAQFKTVVAYIDSSGNSHTFTGTIKGQILTEKIGTRGFGYDPIFQPDGYEKSFAEMEMVEKNLISHRSKAVKQLVDFLTKSERS